MSNINTVSGINIIECNLLDTSRENTFQERTATNIITATCKIATAKSMRRIIGNLFFFKRDEIHMELKLLATHTHYKIS